MIRSPFERRSAELFDDLLEGRVDAASPELERLLSFAEQVWAVPAPEPRADFAVSLRERLMTEAPAAMVAGATDDRLIVAVPALKRTSQRRVAAAVAVVAVAGAATGTAFAAESALPGDTLYPVKRLVESAHTAVSLGDTSKGGVELGRASTRLEEATALAKAGRADHAADALTDFVSQATRGADLLTAAGKGADIHDFTAASVTELEGLTGLLPADLLGPVLQALLTIDKAATAALPDAGNGITELPSSLVQLLSSATTTRHGGSAAAPRPSSSPTSPSAKPTRSAGGSKEAGGAPTAPGSTTSTPKAKPSTVGGVVGGVGDAVGGGIGGLGTTLGQVGDGVGGPVGGVIGGLGDTVGGVGGAVGGLLNGVGGLLDGQKTKAP